MKERDIIEFFKGFEIDEFELRLSEGQYLGFDHSSENKVCSIGVLNISKMLSNGFSCYIQFPNYEKLNRETRNQEDEEYSPPSVRPYNQRSIIDYEFGKGISDKFPIIIHTKSDLESIFELFRTYYFQDARPFFEYWRDVRSFIPFIEKDSREAALLLSNTYILKKNGDLEAMFSSKL